MSYDQKYPFPQVFLVDGGGGQGQSAVQPNLVPCWSFPQAQETVRSRSKNRGCMGVSCSLVMIVLMLFLLVFAALGVEAWQILRLQEKLKDRVEPEPVTESHGPQKQIGLYNPDSNGEKKTEEKPETPKRPVAHVVGRFGVLPPYRMTLRWESKVGRGRVLMSGSVEYIDDGALQVNKEGLYYIYSRVELRFRNCDPATSFKHVMFVRRAEVSDPMILMEAYKSGFCLQKPDSLTTTESYLGGVLKLMTFDRVYVNVSRPTDLSSSHDGNFFGLYKI